MKCAGSGKMSSENEKTIEDALDFADKLTEGATFYDGKWDVQVVLAMLADEVRRLRKENKS